MHARGRREMTVENTFAVNCVLALKQVTIWTAERSRSVAGPYNKDATSERSEQGAIREGPVYRNARLGRDARYDSVMHTAAIRRRTSFRPNSLPQAERTRSSQRHCSPPKTRTVHIVACQTRSCYVALETSEQSSGRT
jgi:hypothetical protein